MALNSPIFNKIMSNMDNTSSLASTSHLRQPLPTKDTQTLGNVYEEPNILDSGLTPNPTGVGESKYSYLLSKEGKDNTYTTKNKAGSSAYGRYQIMPKTGNWMANKLGLQGSWDTPGNQEKVMDGLDSMYTDRLKGLNVDVNDSNKYVVHQLGTGRAGRYFNNKLTDSDVNVMNDNLPAKLKGNNKMDIVGNWMRLYNQ